MVIGAVLNSCASITVLPTRGGGSGWMRRPIVQTRRMCCRASDRLRALAPHSISAATGRCNVSSPTFLVLAASFVSMVANLRLNTLENSADAVAKEQSNT